MSVSLAQCPLCNVELVMPPASQGKITANCPTHGPVLEVTLHPDFMAQVETAWLEPS